MKHEQTLADTVYPLDDSLEEQLDCPYCACPATRLCAGCNGYLCGRCYECHNGDHYLEDEGCHMDTCDRGDACRGR